MKKDTALKGMIISLITLIVSFVLRNIVRSIVRPHPLDLLLDILLITASLMLMLSFITSIVFVIIFFIKNKAEPKTKVEKSAPPQTEVDALLTRIKALEEKLVKGETAPATVTEEEVTNVEKPQSATTAEKNVAEVNPIASNKPTTVEVKEEIEQPTATPNAVSEENQTKETKKTTGGFFKKMGDTIKNPFQKIATENPYFKLTMARINNRSSLYANVNMRVKDGDFRQGCYLSIIDGNGVLYGSSQADYVFESGDIVGFEYIGRKSEIKFGNENVLAMTFIITFKDGKKAEADMIVFKLKEFIVKLQVPYVFDDKLIK